MNIEMKKHTLNSMEKNMNFRCWDVERRILTEGFRVVDEKSVSGIWVFECVATSEGFGV